MNVRSLLLGILTLFLVVSSAVRAAAPQTVAEWNTQADAALVDHYAAAGAGALLVPDLTAVVAHWSDAARQIALEKPAESEPFAFAIGRARARLQQAIVLEMTQAIAGGDVARAQSLRVELPLPRGVSSAEGALLMQTLTGANRTDAARILAREAVTWQTTRIRVLLDEALRSTKEPQPMPRRLLERLGEATTLADLPEPLRAACEVKTARPTPQGNAAVINLAGGEWVQASIGVDSLRKQVESSLPVLLSDKERERRERLMLKLIQLVPREYASGVREGQIAVPLEYREAVTFTRQARQIFGELAPLWLGQGDAATQEKRRASVAALETQFDLADKTIAAKAPGTEVEAVLKKAATIVEDDFGVSLRRSGTTADIVDEVMLEVRSLLSSSLASALQGNWEEAERLRLEAYTTFDPDLEARLMPRDPQLAIDIEHLLLDGKDKPGVKMLLDRKAGSEELTEAYAAVHSHLDRAVALLKAGVSPTAAAVNAMSIVLREGLEGLLVVVAIFAGLRGAENAGRRRYFWIGIILSMVATAVTWILSRTLITSLHAYGEIIEAVTGLLAVGVLLLITNWLFQQVYWRQWVTSLKSQAGEGSNPYQLMMVGFLVGYREGFETVLFLQSLILDAGGMPVSIGVAVGCVSLLALGVAALKIGLKLPYYKILLVTALLIGVVLLSFVGTTARAMQTVGWLPVHRLMPGSWPAWVGSWLGIFNTLESVGAQLLTGGIVIGTWRWARWKAKRKSKANARQRQIAEARGCTVNTGGTCSLETLGVGCCGQVVGIAAADDELRKTLETLGLCDGERVECIARTPQSHVEFRVRGSLVTLSGEHARYVTVRELEIAEPAVAEAGVR